MLAHQKGLPVREGLFFQNQTSIMRIFTLLLAFLSVLPFTFSQSLTVPFGDLRARDIGPAVMSGRISALGGVTSDPKILYIGAANGGVWKSIDAGASFRPVFDEHTQSIGSITIDQQHPDTIWVGTGESWVRNSTSVGTGIYVSTNGGNSWTFKGLPDSERITRVAIDSYNPAVVYAAVQGHLWGPNEERGVYKSTDFGQSWKKILYVDENTGATDLVMDPQNSSILYAAMWEHRRSAHFFNSGGPGSGLYKTTDGGVTWTKIHNGLPEGNFGRIGIGLAPSNSDVIYISLECEKQEEKGIYRSSDGGASWEHVNKDFNSTVRPFYFSRVVVDPNDENRIFKCGLNLTISNDGGASFRTVGSGVHSDIHDVWVNPNNSDHVVIGTDGGGYRSLDGGYKFEMFMDLPITQFYQVSIDNADPYHVYGGLQDNGSWYGPSSSPGGVENKDWELSNWGDGFYSFRHPSDPDIIYSESQGGNIVRYNKRDGQAKNIKPIEEEGEPKLRFNWNTPIQLSPNDDERLYVGAQYLFVSHDRGDSWERISPDLTTNNPWRQRQAKSGGLSIDNSTAENNTTIYTITESPLNDQMIWVGTDDGNLQLTTDFGKNWTNVEPNIPDMPDSLWCTSVEPSRFDANTCYVTFTGHKSGDKGIYVYKTTDLGQTWTSIVTDELKGYAHCIKEDLVAGNLLFLGTEFGLFISIDAGQSWKKFTNNLPGVSVRDMAIHPRDHALVIGTHGRGIYIIDDLQVLREVNPDIAGESLHFFDLGPTYIQLPQQGSPFGGAGNYRGENPNEAVKIAYFMRKRHTFGTMKMELLNQAGEVIKDLPAGKSGGINLVNIPIRLPLPKAAPTKNRSALGGSLFPPTLEEGRYTVRITKKKEVFETSFDLRFDPKHEATYPEADRKLAHDTQMRLYNMTNQLGYMYYAMEAMHEQASDRNQDLKKKTAKALSEFEAKVKAYKESLVSLEGDFYVDSSSNLREDISTLLLGVSFYPGKPSDGQVRKTGEYEESMKTVREKFEAFKSQMEELNASLAKAGKKEMTVESFEEYISK
jgi:photosystem II stability/assembly factor-like uncharacterized protein